MSRYSRFFDSRLARELERETFVWEGLDVSVGRRPVPGADLACIVLHGGGGNSDLVAPLVNAIGEAGFEALAPDLPGYGGTEVPRGRFRYGTWIALVRALAAAEARDGRPVAVFGLSMGGMLGYHAACVSPAIVGVAATNLLDPRDPAVMRAASRSPLMARATAMMLPALDQIAVPIRWLVRMDLISNDPELARACSTDPRGGGSRVPLGFLRSWIAHRPELEPESFDRPVLLAHPGDDRWTPTAVSKPFFDRLAGPKRFVELENCGHAPIEEPGSSVLEAELGSFLAELAADRRLAPAKG